jgi:GTP-binding protein
MLKQAGIFRENQEVADCVMDSGDIERERGITITAKNTAVQYKDTKINIIDTPGHADFGGEVERVLNMVDGVLLLACAREGAMPQTRFVLSKSLEMQKKLIIVVNKVDRPDARTSEIHEEILNLLLELGADETYFDSPVIYCSAKKGISTLEIDEVTEDMEIGDLTPLFETILTHIPEPNNDTEGDLQMLISSIDYNEYVGKIGIGKINRGIIKVGEQVRIGTAEENYTAKISNLYGIDGLGRTPIETGYAGDIVCIAGIENINIGETVCNAANFEALPFTKISEPTVEMTFYVNDSPFAGSGDYSGGKFVTSRQLRERLYKELLRDVALKIEDSESTDAFRVLGRGEMHLSILIETLRREGYELAVGSPKVIYKEIDGEKCEPIERLVIDVPNENVGAIMSAMGQRKGELQSMEQQETRTKLEFLIPARGLFGYKTTFLTDTKGEGIMSSVFEKYEPFKGEIENRNTGSLVVYESGESTTYGLYNAQERGVLFIGPGEPVYTGQVIGYSPKWQDIELNVCKKKHLTNTRASGSDDALRLTPAKNMSLEECLEFIIEDELVEVTPKVIRIRKKILDSNLRNKASK